MIIVDGRNEEDTLGQAEAIGEVLEGRRPGRSPHR